MSNICKECGRTLPRLRLTKTDVQDIFQMSYSVDEIAKLANVTRQTVWLIKTRKTHADWTEGLVKDSVR